MNPTLTPPAAADPIDRPLAAFFSGRGHTTDAYTRDLDDFTAFVRRRAGHDTAALRWFFGQTPGEANNLVLHYKTELLTRGKATGTTARHLSVIKSLAKYARMTGLITWAIEVTSPRIERSRDTRGPTVETLQAMLALAAAQPNPTGPAMSRCYGSRTISRFGSASSPGST